MNFAFLYGCRGDFVDLDAVSVDLLPRLSERFEPCEVGVIGAGRSSARLRSRGGGRESRFTESPKPAT